MNARLLPSIGYVAALGLKAFLSDDFGGENLKFCHINNIGFLRYA